VTELGGSIEVESAPGRGSLFRVVLVQWTEPGEAPAPPSRPERALARRRGRVLVVDDEALVAASVRRALASEHDVTTVVGGREALEHLAACHEYDVVVSDLLMPEITGIELWNALRERCPELAGRMVFLTGGAFTPASGEFVEAHRDACLQKPFALGELRDLVRSRMK
jgi:CheY-like chemotaxis protein